MMRDRLFRSAYETAKNERRSEDQDEEDEEEIAAHSLKAICPLSFVLRSRSANEGALRRTKDQ
jgi:hypothetical protein